MVNPYYEMLEKARQRYLATPFNQTAHQILLSNLMREFANQKLVDTLRGEDEFSGEAGESNSPLKDSEHAF